MTQELKTRWIFALIVVAIVSTIILFLGPLFIFGFGLVAGLLGWREYSRLVGLKNKSSLYLWGYAWVIFALISCYFMGPKTLFWFWLAPLSSFAILAGERLLVIWKVKGAQEESPERAWQLMQDFTFGCIYVFLLFGFIGPIGMKTQGQALLFTGITAIALGDTAAYFGGKRWGKRKLWPALSPGKTLEGAYSSILGAILGALICWTLISFTEINNISILSCLLIGIVAAPLGVLGDLLESLIKRVYGVKDSGALLPGHGGLLDRLDAYVFMFPLIYFIF